MLDRREDPDHRRDGQDRLPDRPGAGAAQRGVGRRPPEESGGSRQTHGRRHHTGRTRHEHRRLLGAARRFHLRVPRGGRHRRRRLGAVRRHERTELRRPAVPLPRRQGFRLLLDRLDLRVPGTAAAAGVRSARRATSAPTTASPRSPPRRCAPGSPSSTASRSRSSASARPTAPKAEHLPIGWT